MKWVIIFILVLSAGCGKVPAQKKSVKKQKVDQFFTSPSLKVKVYYEPGAEPYTQDVILQYWNVLETNMKALFSGRIVEPILNIPKNLNEMTVLPLSGDTSWTIEDVLNLSKKHGQGDSSTFEIYFVNGFSSEGSGVIGFQISGTQIIVVFKDVIRGTGSGNLEAVPKYVEQATLVHEMGHALGLVNNGVPMVENHEENDHHCSNPHCVMYYTNEGTKNLVEFATKVFQTGDTVMFDDKCLKDTRSF